MATGGAIDELRAVAVSVARATVLRLPGILLGTGILITALIGFAFAGAVLDDQAIAANPGTAQADVLEGSTPGRTLIRFTAANGAIVVPETGVFYPRGLVAGDSVAVEYDVRDPDLVRVAGRTALDVALPLGLGVLVTWTILAPIASRLRRRQSPG